MVTLPTKFCRALCLARPLAKALLTIAMLTRLIGCAQDGHATGPAASAPPQADAATAKVVDEMTQAAAKSFTLPQTSTQPKKLEVPADRMAKVAESTTVSCENSAHCPENVALLLLKSGSQVYQCSGFLIGPGLLLTNRHCLPEKLAVAGARCPGVTALFPATSDRAAEVSNCDQVLTVSSPPAKNENDSLDYALLRLDRTSARKPMEINRGGIEPGGHYSAIVVDPKDPDTLDGIIRIKPCVSVAGTILAPGYTQPLSRVVSFSGGECLIEHGNSGSPLLDADGKVRGLIFATVAAQTQNLIETGAVNFYAMALADNLGCLDLHDGVKPNPACLGAPSRSDMIRQAFIREKTEQIERIFEAWLLKEQDQLPPGLDLIADTFKEPQKDAPKDGKEDSDVRYYAPQLICADSVLAKPSQFQVPVWKLRMKFNRLYQISWVSSWVGAAELKLVFKPELSVISKLTTPVDGLQINESPLPARFCPTGSEQGPKHS